MDDLKIVRGNDFYIHVPVRKIVFVKDDSGNSEKVEEKVDLWEVQDLQVNLVPADCCAKRKVEHHISGTDTSELYFLAETRFLLHGWYGIEITGIYDDNAIRCYEKRVFKITESNEYCHIDCDIHQGEPFPREDDEPEEEVPLDDEEEEQIIYQEEEAPDDDEEPEEEEEESVYQTRIMWFFATTSSGGSNIGYVTVYDLRGLVVGDVLPKYPSQLRFAYGFETVTTIPYVHNGVKGTLVFCDVIEDGQEVALVYNIVGHTITNIWTVENAPDWVKRYIQSGSDEYVHIDCGEWVDGSTIENPTLRHGKYLYRGWNEQAHQYESHDVWHEGHKWRCLVDQPRTVGGVDYYDEPKWNSTSWLMIEGNDNYSIEFSSSKGYSFRRGNVDTVVTPHLFYGNTDITDDVDVTNWSWERESESGKTEQDRTWDALHTGIAMQTKQLHLTNNDMPATWSSANKAIFTCTVVIPDNGERRRIQNQIIA